MMDKVLTARPGAVYGQAQIGYISEAGNFVCIMVVQSMPGSAEAFADRVCMAWVMLLALERSVANAMGRSV